MTSLLFAFLATYGWALVLTKGRGPFGILSRLRGAQSGTDVKRQSVLTCPMCIGWWIGAFFAALHTISIVFRVPLVERIGYLIAAPGAASGAAWLGVHLADLARRAAEHQAQRAFAVNKKNDKRRTRAP